MKYEYVTVKFKHKLSGTGQCTEHRKIIDDYAQKGYRYVGFIPISIFAQGAITEIDLIFEKQE